MKVTINNGGWSREREAKAIAASFTFVVTPNDMNQRERDPNNEMRRKIIAMFTQMGYVTHEGGKQKADMPRIYQWVKKSGYLHKPLNSYNKNELPKLVSQVEVMYKKHVLKHG